MKRTATTANAILGLLSLRPSWPTYEINRQLRRNMRFFWPRAESRIYDEARRLVEKGLASSSEERAGRRSRTVYSITPEGRREVERWLATPPRATSLECEPLLRIFLADLSSREQLQAALDQVKADAEAVFQVGRVVGDEYLKGTSPFQDQVHVRALVFDFLWSHAMMLRSWTERAEAAIDRWQRMSPEERDRLGQEVIRAALDEQDPQAREAHCRA
jgi:PadR family transcriptional regulator AphA